MGSQPSTRRYREARGRLWKRTYTKDRIYDEKRNPTKGSLKSKTLKVFRLGFLFDTKGERKRQHYGRLSVRDSASMPPDVSTPMHYRNEEIPYHPDRPRRRSGRHDTTRSSSSASPPVNPASNLYQSGSRGGSLNHSLALGPPAVYPQPQVVTPSYADRSIRIGDYGPPVIMPRSSKSARSRHESGSRSVIQPAVQSYPSATTGPLTQPRWIDPSQKRHPHRELPRQFSNVTHDSPAYRSVTTHNYVAPEGNQPGVTTISSHTECRSEPGQRPIPSLPPVPQIPLPQSYPPIHSRHPKPSPQAWESWRPPALQPVEKTKPTTHRIHRSKEGAPRGPSASNQSLPVMLSQDGHRDAGESKPGERNSKSHRPSSSHGENSDDRGRRYDRELGERAAERRAPKSSKRRSASTEAPASTKTAPMKFYRPGDPRHPSFKPISAEFKRRHAYVLGGTSG